MTRLHWLLYSCPSTRTTGDARVLNRLRHSNSHIHRAWVLKDEFAQLCAVTYKCVPDKFVRRRLTSPLGSHIPSLHTFIGTRTTHFDTMLAFAECALINAVADGYNRIIKIVKNCAGRNRNLDVFTDISTSNARDFDISAHIQSNLPTLPCHPVHLSMKASDTLRISPIARIAPLQTTDCFTIAQPSCSNSNLPDYANRDSRDNTHAPPA